MCQCLASGATAKGQLQGQHRRMRQVMHPDHCWSPDGRGNHDRQGLDWAGRGAMLRWWGHATIKTSSRTPIHRVWSPCSRPILSTQLSDFRPPHLCRRLTTRGRSETLPGSDTAHDSTNGGTKPPEDEPRQRSRPDLVERRSSNIRRKDGGRRRECPSYLDDHVP